MDEFYSRTVKLTGEEGLLRLKSAKVAVFGLGGVGSYAAEALIRSGVGEIHLFDGDCVVPSNKNRQLIALDSTLSQNKAEVLCRRATDINSEVKAVAHPVFYTPDNADEFSFDGLSYIIDAVDSVSAKLEIIKRAEQAMVPHISCMGTGNKLHPELLEVADVFETTVCPLAKVMRRELKQLGITSLKVVYSREEPILSGDRSVIGSMSFVPGAAGLITAAEAVRCIIGK